MVVCLVAVVAWAPSVEAQGIYMDAGPLGTGSYLRSGFFQHPRSYGFVPHPSIGSYYPNFFFTVPQPPIGGYLPRQVVPPPVHVLPPVGIVPPPYPYFYYYYPPPVYGFGPYFQPHYSPPPVHPYAIRPFGYPRADRRYRELMERRQQIAPPDTNTAPAEDPGPTEETPTAPPSPPAVEPNQP
jgi:hypothetical protein